MPALLQITQLVGKTKGYKIAIVPQEVPVEKAMINAKIKVKAGIKE